MDCTFTQQLLLWQPIKLRFYKEWIRSHWWYEEPNIYDEKDYTLWKEKVPFLINHILL